MDYTYILPSRQLAEIVRSKLSSRRDSLKKLNSVYVDDGRFSADSGTETYVKIFVAHFNLSALRNEVSDANRTSILAIREPKSSLLSWYWEFHPFNNITFRQFVSEEIEKKSLFLSTLHHSWLERSSSYMLLPIDVGALACEKKSPITTYLCEVGYSAIKLEAGIIESMYDSISPKATQPFIVRNTSVGASVLEEESVLRIRAIILKSRPFFEYSRQFNLTDLIDSGALTTENFVELQDYANQWHIDAQKFLSSEEYRASSNGILKNAVALYLDKKDQSLTIPTENFYEKLPLNSNWSIINRILAAGL
jgi:hypothetical protein